MIDFRKLAKVYLIGEIGINHNGDIQIAKRLIDSTFACGWDCVKFQKRDPDKSVPENQKSILRSTPWGRMTYLEYRKKIEFGKKEYSLIDDYCRQKPIDWTASVWDVPSLEFLLGYNPPFVKIPSAQMTNKILVEKIAESGFPIVMSTGMSTPEEIDSSVELLLKYTSNFVLMHTNSAYPAPDGEINLRVMNTLRERYKCLVGYSGHEFGLEASVLAIALGAMVLERHITLDHGMWGTDQKASLEIEGMDKLIRRIRTVPIYLGSDEKKVARSEIPIRQKLRGK